MAKRTLSLLNRPKREQKGAGRKPKAEAGGMWVVNLFSLMIIRNSIVLYASGILFFSHLFMEPDLE